MSVGGYIYAIIRGEECIGRWHIPQASMSPLEDFMTFLEETHFPGKPYDEIYVRVAHRPAAGGGAVEKDNVGEPEGNA